MVFSSLLFPGFKYSLPEASSLMKKLLEKSVYLVLISVVFSLLAALAASVWGAVKTVLVIKHLVLSTAASPVASVELIALMDSFLIATALLIFALGLYELFIEEIKLPEWLVVHDLDDLKVKLSSVMILVMAVTFLEHLVEWKDPLGMLYFGIAVAAVSASLIAFGWIGKKI
jgi:uncharacterized membrane protein YqhA